MSSLNEILTYPKTDGSLLMFPVPKMIYSLSQKQQLSTAAENKYYSQQEDITTHYAPKSLIREHAHPEMTATATINGTLFCVCVFN